MSVSPIKNKIISFSSLFTSVALFIIISYFLRNNLNLFENIVFSQGKIIGMFYYVVLSILLVATPLASSIPLIPVASLAWGWAISGLLTSLAWIIGTQLLFEASRKIGKPLFGNIVSKRHIKRIQNILQKKNFYFEIVLLRVFFYDDILSYALGIFTNLKRSQVFYINVAGVIPPAFILAYFGTLAIEYQIILMLSAVLIFSFVFYKRNGNSGN